MNGGKNPLACMTRRDLLAGTAKITAAGGFTIFAGSGLGLLSGCANSGSTTESETLPGSRLPYPYVKFDDADIKRVQATAHENWFKGFCAFAVFSGIVTLLREKVGEPYSSFPMEVITYGHGGTAGWGGTCGALTGSGLAAALAAGPKDGEKILNEVISWYNETELPLYLPQNQRAEINTKNLSGSPLCHVSVGKWMKKERVGFLSSQQMERCARLSADVAAKTVELLNAHADLALAAARKDQVSSNGMPSQNNCSECHGNQVPAVPEPGGGEL